ncbi:MAG: alkaline phosphatase D family protein [Myxococcota bacterium]|nr:alkaline phosphatase D family protein [Myxococcota bacterium]
MRRRDFLWGAGAFVVTAKLAGCGDNIGGPDAGPDAPTARGTFTFPQGVASGDPRANSVVLWTRVSDVNPSSQPISIRVEVFEGESVDTAPVVSQLIEATFASDHCVRVLVNMLKANTVYSYRFTAGQDSITGRTHTAPDADADVQVNVAWVSCQDYQAGHFTAYLQMIEDDRARPVADRINFVVHLGDVIYETIGESSQRPIDAGFQPIAIRNADGSPRTVPTMPQGGRNGVVTFATTVADYRHLYKRFLSDPSIQAARARWPFIHTWDDHEFTNDSWQSMANYGDTVDVDEPSQSRKLAASQAWFEYTPAHLTGATGPGGVAQDAKDFAGAMVSTAPFTAPNADNFVAEPNNAAAIGAMTIYRSLRWGKHVELVMTDERSYRSDHAIPESTAALVPQVFFDPRNFLPLPVVNTFDQGSTANGGAPPATVGGIPNPRRNSPVGTMLGKAQKAWWKATMMASTATWKLWGNEVPLMRMFIEGDTTGLGFDRILDGDAWDGYPTERAELMTFLRTQNIKNVVALTGDIHAHFAGEIVDDPDVAVPVPVMTELISAGISSNSLFSFYEAATRTLPASLRSLVTVNDGAASPFTENLNLLLRFGTQSAGTYAAVRNIPAALAATDGKNAHIKYADTNAQGYGYAKITATEIVSTLVTVNRPTLLPHPGLPGVRRTATVTIPKVDAVTAPSMTPAVVTGIKPFPLT